MSTVVIPKWVSHRAYRDNELVEYAGVFYVSLSIQANNLPTDTEFWAPLTSSGLVADATTTTKGLASFAAADFNVAAGAVSIDYTNGQAATSLAKGFLTAADWSTFNAKQDTITQVAGTDAATPMATKSIYVVDMAAWATANRVYTLPATAAAGDEVTVVISGGNASFELVLTAAAGDTLNGVAGGTEWSRLFITGEVVRFRCVVANATWVVAQDSRIPQVGVLRLSTTADGETAATFTRPTQAATPGAWTAEINVGSPATAASDRMTARRAGNYYVEAKSAPNDAITGAATASINVTKNDEVTAVLNPVIVAGGVTSFPELYTAVTLPLVADDFLVYLYATSQGGKGLFAGIAYNSYFTLREIL